MISSDSMRGFNDLLILIVLSKGDSYGYEISKTISSLSKDLYELKETTMYSAIKRLEKNALIEGYEVNETFGRKRVNYRLSQEGSLKLKEKILEWKEISCLLDKFIEYEEI